MVIEFFRSSSFIFSYDKTPTSQSVTQALLDHSGSNISFTLQIATILLDFADKLHLSKPVF